MDDTVQEILLRLPVKSLARCKCLSKKWRDVISLDKSFCNSYLCRLRGGELGRGDSMLVGIFLTKSRSTTEVPNRVQFLPTSFDGSRNNVRKRKRDDGQEEEEIDWGLPLRPPDESLVSFLGGPESPHIVGSSNGLLLCSRQQMKPIDYFICNPITKQWVSLPPANTTSRYVTHGFISHSTCPSLDLLSSYRVVRIIWQRAARAFTTTITIEVFSSGFPHQWEILNLHAAFSFCLDVRRYSAVVSKNEVTYMSALVKIQAENTACFVSFDQRKEDCLRLVDLPVYEEGGYHSDCLGISNGLVLYALHQFGQLRVWVLDEKDDFSVEWSLNYKVPPWTIRYKRYYFVSQLNHWSGVNVYLKNGEMSSLWTNLSAIAIHVDSVEENLDEDYSGMGFHWSQRRCISGRCGGLPGWWHMLCTERNFISRGASMEAGQSGLCGWIRFRGAVVVLHGG